MPLSTIKICLATNNKGKIAELKSLLPSKFELVSLQDINCLGDLPETGFTFAANAAEKANYVFKNYHINAIADDSGLEVEALGGEPGVFSARYAGEHGNDKMNITLLLQNLSKENNRKAFFKTVISLIINNSHVQFEGKVEGNIINEIRGENGFGYDPVFIPKGFDKTFAEMTIEEKNLISHRAVATKKLIAYLETL